MLIMMNQQPAHPSLFGSQTAEEKKKTMGRGKNNYERITAENFHMYQKCYKCGTPGTIRQKDEYILPLAPGQHICKVVLRRSQAPAPK